ncbi:PQQ-like beta-propeller repeat protein [Aureispira]|nr:PQQ-like beta-propeller repeat protein [Aureispira sp.]
MQLSDNKNDCLNSLIRAHDGTKTKDFYDNLIENNQVSCYSNNMSCIYGTACQKIIEIIITPEILVENMLQRVSSDSLFDLIQDNTHINKKYTIDFMHNKNKYKQFLYEFLLTILDPVDAEIMNQNIQKSEAIKNNTGEKFPYLCDDNLCPCVHHTPVLPGERGQNCDPQELDPADKSIINPLNNLTDTGPGTIKTLLLNKFKEVFKPVYFKVVVNGEDMQNTIGFKNLIIEKATYGLKNILLLTDNYNSDDTLRLYSKQDSFNPVPGWEIHNETLPSFHCGGGFSPASGYKKHLLHLNFNAANARPMVYWPSTPTNPAMPSSLGVIMLQNYVNNKPSIDAFDATTGEWKWSNDSVIDLNSNLTLSTKNKVLFASTSSNCICLDVLSGDLVWSNSDIQNADSKASGNIVVFASGRNIVFIQISTGNTLYNNDTSKNNSLRASPSICPYKSSDGSCHCFEFSSDGQYVFTSLNNLSGPPEFNIYSISNEGIQKLKVDMNSIKDTIDYIAISDDNKFIYCYSSSICAVDIYRLNWNEKSVAITFVIQIPHIKLIDSLVISPLQDDNTRYIYAIVNENYDGSPASCSAPSSISDASEQPLLGKLVYYIQNANTDNLQQSSSTSGTTLPHSTNIKNIKTFTFSNNTLCFIAAPGNSKIKLYTLDISKEYSSSKCYILPDTYYKKNHYRLAIINGPQENVVIKKYETMIKNDEILLSNLTNDDFKLRVNVNMNQLVDSNEGISSTNSESNNFLRGLFSHRPFKFKGNETDKPYLAQQNDCNSYNSGCYIVPKEAKYFGADYYWSDIIRPEDFHTYWTKQYNNDIFWTDQDRVTNYSVVGPNPRDKTGTILLNERVAIDFCLSVQLFEMSGAQAVSVTRSARPTLWSARVTAGQNSENSAQIGLNLSIDLTFNTATIFDWIKKMLINNFTQPDNNVWNTTTPCFYDYMKCKICESNSGKNCPCDSSLDTTQNTASFLQSICDYQNYPCQTYFCNEDSIFENCPTGAANQCPPWQIFYARYKWI